MSLRSVLRSAREGKPSLILKAGDTKRCDPEEQKWECGKGHVVTKTYACARRRCISGYEKNFADRRHCVRHADRERSAFGRTLSADAFPVPWLAVVFPSVSRLRKSLARADLLAALRAEAAKLLERTYLTWNGCDPKDWRLGIISCDHPEGDQERTEGKTVWKPHHNFLFPNIAFHRRIPNSRRKNLRYFPTTEQLKELRQAWGALQNRILVSFGEEPVKEANFFWSFRKTKKHRAHMAKYFCRSFPWWPGRAQRLSYFGAFGCRVVKRLNEVEALGVSLAGPQECPVCGAAIVKLTGSTVTPHYREVSSGGNSS